MSESVLEHMVGAGIPEESARSDFAAGLVFVDGARVTDPDRPMEAGSTIVLRQR